MVMKKNKTGKVKMVYNCMVDSKQGEDMLLENDFLRYDGTRGVMYSKDEMEALGLGAVYSEYLDVDDMVRGAESEEKAIDNIMLGRMFPLVSGMAIIATMQGRDPAGFHILGKVRKARDGSLQLVVCMMSFYSGLEKNLYLLTAVDKCGAEITYKRMVSSSESENFIGVQNMLQIMN